MEHGLQGVIVVLNVDMSVALRLQCPSKGCQKRCSSAHLASAPVRTLQHSVTVNRHLVVRTVTATLGLAKRFQNVC